MKNRTLCLLAIGILFAQNAHGADQQAPPPTKWDSRVTDTFFPDARKALNGERPKWLSPNAARVSAGKTGGEKPSAAGDDTAVGAFAWSKLVSPETLADEVKSLNTDLIDEVKTQQAFLGGANKKSRRTLSMLAVTFGIINEYAGDVKWKAQAAAARDLFSRAGFNCKAATEQTLSRSETAE